MRRIFDTASLLKNKKLTSIILTLLIFSLSLTPLLWFPGKSILLGYDNIYPLAPLDFLKNRLFTWSQAQGLGIDQSGIQGSLIVHFIDSLPQLLGLSVQTSQKIVFSFWFFLLLLSPFILIKRLEKYSLVRSPYLSYIFPVLYSFNFYILQAWWIVERTKFSLVVATPLILSIILPMIKEKLTVRRVFLNSIACALILFVFNGGGWEGMSIFGGLIVVLLSFYFFSIFVLFITKRKSEILYFSLFFLFFGFLYLLLNAYTLLPFLFSTLREYNTLLASAGGVSGIIDWARYLSENASFINLLRLQGIPDWYNNILYHPYASFYLNNPVLIFISFLFPVFLLLSTLFVKKENFEERKIITFFLFLLVISLFFTAGFHKPLDALFGLLMKYIPGFIIFRSPIFKFGYAYWLAASFLIGLFLSLVVEYVVQKIKNVGISKFAGFLIPAFIIIVILVYHFPYFTGDIFRSAPKQVSSRVEVPDYVYEFSKWWNKEGQDDRILLLPKLSHDWVFEQYRWGYLSLFPLLGNFGTHGIVENTDLIKTEEANIIDSLYEAINNRDHKKTDFFASILGIDHFLVRRDFYFDLSGYETDNPGLIENNLSENPSIGKIAEFGDWVVYQYKNNKRPLIFAKEDAVGILGGGIETDLSLSQDTPLFLDKTTVARLPQTFSEIVITPECLSCSAEKEEIQVTIPEPKILLDSPLYEGVSFLNQLRKPKIEGVDNQEFRLVGETLKLAGQLKGLLVKDAGSYFINLVREEYERELSFLEKNAPSVLNESQNPYSAAIIVQQYLDFQMKHVNELRVRTSKREDLVNLEKILYALGRVGDEYRDIFGKDDINVKKVYFLEVTLPGEYSIKVRRDTLGIVQSKDYGEISLSIDNAPAFKASKIEEGYIDFGTRLLDRGKHTLTLNLSPQEQVKLDLSTQSLAGSNCFSSFLRDFSAKKIYDVRFQIKNNFDPDLFFFIDDGKSFSPYLLLFFPLAGEQVNENRFVVSRESLPIDQSAKTLRLAFCAPSLDAERYSNNIKQLSAVELPIPKVALLKKSVEGKIGVPPKISYRKIDPTHYKILVDHAERPFYLVLNQRYGDAWSASIGEHFRGNRFANVWFIDKRGDYTVDVVYKPQKLFVIGGIVSVISALFSISIVIFATRRKNK